MTPHGNCRRSVRAGRPCGAAGPEQTPGRQPDADQQLLQVLQNRDPARNEEKMREHVQFGNEGDHAAPREYLGDEEITVPKGTYSCSKLQVKIDSGLLTIWIFEGLPPVKITLEQGQNIVTMEMT